MENFQVSDRNIINLTPPPPPNANLDKYIERKLILKKIIRRKRWRQKERQAEKQRN